MYPPPGAQIPSAKYRTGSPSLPPLLVSVPSTRLATNGSATVTGGPPLSGTSTMR